MDNGYIINSKEYWDDRFKSGSWEEYRGSEQTLYFAQVLMDNLPYSLITDLKKNNYSMLDFGCGLGQLCNLWSEMYNSKYIVGLDLSEEARHIAETLYPHLTFESYNMSDYLFYDNYDIVVTSNTLEHLKDYDKYIDIFTKSANKYIIILVPFESEIFDEHVVSFDMKSFPKYIGKEGKFQHEFKKFYEKIIDTRSSGFWNGYQYLVIYERC